MKLSKSFIFSLILFTLASNAIASKNCEVVCTEDSNPDDIGRAIFAGLKTISRLGFVSYRPEKANCFVVSPSGKVEYSRKRGYVGVSAVAVSQYGKNNYGYVRYYKSEHKKKDKLLASLKTALNECVERHSLVQTESSFPNSFRAAKVPLIIRRFDGMNTFELNRENAPEDLKELATLISILPNAITEGETVSWSSELGSLKMVCSPESCKIMVQPGIEVTPETYQRSDLKFRYGSDEFLKKEFKKKLMDTFKLRYDRYTIIMNFLEITVANSSMMIQISPKWGSWTNSRN